MNVIAHPRLKPIDKDNEKQSAAGQLPAAGSPAASAPAGEMPAVTAAPGAGAIRVRGLEKRFGDNQVLRGLDLDIPAGQFVAVIGKSGCGKAHCCAS